MDNNQSVVFDSGAPQALVDARMMPVAGSAAETAGEVPTNPFFEQVSFVGGIGPGEDWIAGWTTNAKN